MSLVVVKAVRLIDLVAEGVDTLADLAAASTLSRSTTHRLLATLVAQNYLALESKRYLLGYRLLELGEKKKRSLILVDLLHPILERYAERTADTIHVAILDGADIILVDRAPGTRQLALASFVGQRAKAFQTAVGKALIGQRPPEKWCGYLKDMPQGYRKTAAQLIDEFKAAQHTNIAIDIDECSIGTCGIAASFAVNDTLRAAASINGATVYFDDDRFDDLRPVVRQMASEMETALRSWGKGARLHAATPQ